MSGCVVVLLALAAAASALSTSSSCAGVNYVGAGQDCTAAFTECREWLYCHADSGLCVELPKVGDNCTLNVGPGGSAEDSCAVVAALRCNSANMTCEASSLDNGDRCQRDSQCLSGNCQMSSAKKPVGMCAGTTPLGGACSLSNYQFNCAKGLTCLTAGAGNLTTTCQAPRKVGVDCTADLLQWAQGFTNNVYRQDTPVGICAPGSACLWVSDSQANCTVLYSGNKGDHCRWYSANPLLPGHEAPPAPYVGTPYCNYNLTCACNTTSCDPATAPMTCTPFVTKTPKNCTKALPSGWGTCPFGDSCNCSATGVGKCAPYVGGDECTPLLQAWVSCLKHKKCNFRPLQLLDQTTIFAGEGNPGSCESCTKQFEQFQCCQSSGFSVKAKGWPKDSPQSVAATDMKYYYSPARQPTGKMCAAPHTLPNWVIPVIVLAAIVLVISAVVCVYVLLPRSYDDHSGYESINKAN